MIDITDLWIAQYVVILLYRLTLHPLAKYPGRLVERLSDWPLVYYCIKGNRHLKQRLAHEKWGESVFSPPAGDHLSRTKIRI